MTPSKHVGQALVDVLVSPTAAFTALRNHRGWGWVALAVLVVSQMVSMYTFMRPMSPEWIVQQQIASANLSPTQIEDARSILMQLAPHAAILAAASSVTTLPLIAALLSLAYFLGERALMQGRNSYGGWYVVALWSMLPLAANALGLVVLSLMASDPNQPLSLANYASLNKLALGLPPGNGRYIWAESISLFHVWSIALAAIAFRVWSAASWPKAVLLAAFPYALVFGIWGALA